MTSLGATYGLFEFHLHGLLRLAAVPLRGSSTCFTTDLWFNGAILRPVRVRGKRAHHVCACACVWCLCLATCVGVSVSVCVCVCASVCCVY